MWQWCCAFQAVAVQPSLSSSTLLDVMLPVRTQDDGPLVDWWSNGLSKHLKVVKLIQLFCFSLLPLIPSDWLLSLRLVKNPSACSSGVAANERTALMVNLSKLLGGDSGVKEESGCLIFEMAQRECTSRVGAEISMLSLVWQRD